MLAWQREPTGVGCGHCGVHGRELEPIHRVPGSDCVTATGRDEIALIGALVSELFTPTPPEGAKRFVGKPKSHFYSDII